MNPLRSLLEMGWTIRVLATLCLWATAIEITLLLLSLLLVFSELDEGRGIGRAEGVVGGNSMSDALSPTAMLGSPIESRL